MFFLMVEFYRLGKGFPSVKCVTPGQNLKLRLKELGASALPLRYQPVNDNNFRLQGG